MFDTQVFAELDRATAQVTAACDDAALATGTQACDALRTVQRVQDVLDGVHAKLLAQVEESEGYADQGASSTTSWARQELRLPAGEAKKRCRAGQTLAVLPDVAAALAAGATVEAAAAPSHSSRPQPDQPAHEAWCGCDGRRARDPAAGRGVV